MAETLADLTAAVNAALSKLSPTDDIPDPTRFQLLEALDKLRGAVEPPIQSLLNICWAVRQSPEPVWRNLYQGNFC